MHRFAEQGRSRRAMGCVVTIVLLLGCGARTARLGARASVADQRDEWDDQSWPASQPPPQPACAVDLTVSAVEPTARGEFVRIPTGVIMRGQALPLPWVSRNGSVIVTLTVDDAGSRLEVHALDSGERRLAVSLGKDPTPRFDLLDDGTLSHIRHWNASERPAERTSTPMSRAQRAELTRRWSDFVPLDDDEQRALDEVGATADIESLRFTSARDGERHHDHTVRAYTNHCIGCLCYEGFLFEHDGACQLRIAPGTERTLGLWVTKEAPKFALVADPWAPDASYDALNQRWILALDSPNLIPVELVDG